MERPTSKAKAYTEWESPPVAIMEDGEAKRIYEGITGININGTNNTNNTNNTNI